MQTFLNVLMLVGGIAAALAAIGVCIRTVGKVVETVLTRYLEFVLEHSEALTELTDRIEKLENRQCSHRL